MLPEHREEDHSIQLEEGKTPPFVRNYKPLSNQENNAILVRKPGGGLRFCVEYRALNAITVKNRYPTPLINETLGKLANAVRFTKLDIIAALNRMRMKKRPRMADSV